MIAEPCTVEPFRDQFQAALFGSVPDHIDRLTWDRARIEAHQLQRLRALLAVAIERSPFHARRLSGIDPTTFELADLARLPVMTKAEMMHHFDDVVTDRRLTRATAEATITATGNMLTTVHAFDEHLREGFTGDELDQLHALLQRLRTNVAPAITDRAENDA